jgi:hypothetical protein
VEGRRQAALQDVLERGLEQVVDALGADLVHGMHAELEQRASVGRQDASVFAHGELAFVQRVDEFGAAVEVQRVRIREALVDEPVLDHAHRHAEQDQHVLLHQARAAGDVEHADDLARRVEHRNRRTGELRELAEEMLVAPHRDRMRGREAGAHAVGAGLGFAPHAAGVQAHGLDLGGELGRGHHVHDHAIGVGQHHRALRVGELLVERGHLVARALDDVGMLVAPALQGPRLDHDRFARASGVEVVLIQAAAPRARDQVVALFVKTSPHDIEHAIGVPVTLPRHQCHWSSPAHSIVSPSSAHC